MQLFEQKLKICFTYVCLGKYRNLVNFSIFREIKFLQILTKAQPKTPAVCKPPQGIKALLERHVYILEDRAPSDQFSIPIKRVFDCSTWSQTAARHNVYYERSSRGITRCWAYLNSRHQFQSKCRQTYLFRLCYYIIKKYKY